jgi:hypothetical protein
MSAIFRPHHALMGALFVYNEGKGKPNANMVY